MKQSKWFSIFLLFCLTSCLHQDPMYLPLSWPWKIVSNPRQFGGPLSILAVKGEVVIRNAEECFENSELSPVRGVSGEENPKISLPAYLGVEKFEMGISQFQKWLPFSIALDHTQVTKVQIYVGECQLRGYSEGSIRDYLEGLPKECKARCLSDLLKPGNVLITSVIVAHQLDFVFLTAQDTKICLNADQLGIQGRAGVELLNTSVLRVNYPAIIAYQCVQISTEP